MSDVDGARLTFEKLDSSSPSRSSARGHCIERSLSGLMISRATRYAPVRRPCFPFLPLSLIFISLYLFVRPPPRCRRTRSIRSCAWKLARAPRVSNERLNSHPPPPPVPAKSHSFPRVSPGSVIFGTFENAVVPATETPDPCGNSDAQAVTPTLRSSDATHIPAVIANVCSGDPAGKVRSRGRMSAAF
jgi:hypothetical protein